MENLKLYVLMHCPYSRKVMNYLKDKNFDVEIKDVAIEENHKRLMEVGRIDQVPCLFIDEKPLYESDDIIAWFRARE